MAILKSMIDLLETNHPLPAAHFHSLARSRPDDVPCPTLFPIPAELGSWPSSWVRPGIAVELVLGRSGRLLSLAEPRSSVESMLVERVLVRKTAVEHKAVGVAFGAGLPEHA